MSISRRNALLGATAAAVVTGATTAPLAIKAVGVRSDRYDDNEPNGLIYIADSLEDHVAQLKGLWRELCAVTEIKTANETGETPVLQDKP